MKNSAIVIGLLAALCTAIFRALDNYVVHNLILASDNLTAVLAYLVIGSWTGLITSIIFSISFGNKLIDPDFKGLVFNNFEMHCQAFIAGSISSGRTLFLLLGNQLGDPSVLIALASLTVLYTLLYDIWKKQTTLAQTMLPLVLMIIGAAASAFNGSISITALGLFYVVIISNGLAACSEAIEQNGVRASDSVNFFIWRFFWLAITGTAIAIVTSLVRGYSDLLVQTIYKSLAYLPWVIALMFFVFVGVGLKLYLKKTHAVSIVLLILSVQIILGYPITLLGNLFQPGIFGNIPNDINIWAIRAIGSICIVLGIVLFQRSSQAEKYN